MVKIPQLDLKSNKILKIIIVYTYLLLYTERSEVENPLNTGRNNPMYRIYVVEPQEVLSTITVFSRREAESICIESFNRAHYNESYSGRVMIFRKIEINKKRVNDVDVTDSAYEVQEHVALCTRVIAEFESPLDAMQFMNSKLNFQWYTNHEDVLILKMVHAIS